MWASEPRLGDLAVEFLRDAALQFFDPHGAAQEHELGDRHAEEGLKRPDEIRRELLGGLGHVFRDVFKMIGVPFVEDFDGNHQLWMTLAGPGDYFFRDRHIQRHVLDDLAVALVPDQSRRCN